ARAHADDLVSAARVARRHRPRGLVDSRAPGRLPQQRRRRQPAAARAGRRGALLASAGGRPDARADGPLAVDPSLRLGALEDAVAAHRSPRLDNEASPTAVQPGDDGFGDVDAKEMAVAVRTNLDRAALDLCLAPPCSALRRVVGRSVDRNARIAEQVIRLHRARHRSDTQLVPGELHLGAADPRGAVAAQSRHGQVLTRRQQPADARGELWLCGLELSPRRQVSAGHGYGRRRCQPRKYEYPYADDADGEPGK